MTTPRDPLLRLAPVMTVREVLHMERLLLDEAPRVKGALDVLEWGSGGSTVYFPEFLRSRGVPFSWLSVEHNPYWHGKVSAYLGDAGLGEDLVRVRLENPTDLDLKDPENRGYPMDEYVAYPETLRRRFDLVFVDGRKRRRCLLKAAEVLVPGGVVVLHDAHREYYHCAFARYPRGRLVPNTTFWEGRLAR